MISPPFAHIAGMPVEETLGMYLPVFVLAFGAITATVRSRFRAAGRRVSARRGEMPSKPS
jgi:hypothetical protein